MPVVHHVNNFWHMASLCLLSSVNIVGSDDGNETISKIKSKKLCRVIIYHHYQSVWEWQQDWVLIAGLTIPYINWAFRFSMFLLRCLSRLGCTSWKQKSNSFCKSNKVPLRSHWIFLLTKYTKRVGHMAFSQEAGNHQGPHTFSHPRQFKQSHGAMSEISG